MRHYRDLKQEHVQGLGTFEGVYHQEDGHDDANPSFVIAIPRKVVHKLCVRSVTQKYNG
jgi:hypothetical protein